MKEMAAPLSCPCFLYVCYFIRWEELRSCGGPREDLLQGSMQLADGRHDKGWNGVKICSLRKRDRNRGKGKQTLCSKLCRILYYLVHFKYYIRVY